MNFGLSRSFWRNFTIVQATRRLETHAETPQVPQVLLELLHAFEIEASFFHAATQVSADVMRRPRSRRRMISMTTSTAREGQYNNACPQTRFSIKNQFIGHKNMTIH